MLEDGSRKASDMIRITGLMDALKPVRLRLRSLQPDDRAAAILSLFKAAQEVWSNAWGNEHHILTTTAGIQALLLLYRKGVEFRGALGDNFTNHEAVVAALSLGKAYVWTRNKNLGRRPDGIALALDETILK